MENKIDIAAILKDCPRGMELDCVIYDGVTLDSVVFESEYHYENTNTYPIKIVTENGFSTRLTKYGQNVDIEEAKCVIFPKGKKTWEGFIPPCQFKDGDIISDNRLFNAVCIFKGEGNIKGTVDFYCGISGISKTCGGNGFIIKDARNRDEHFGEINKYNFATEKERQELFQTIKDNGYKWDEKTKTLEKLIKPKFKVGDIVKSKNCPIADNFVIVGVEEDNYSIGFKNYCIKFKDQDNYEVINKPKFKVGDRVKPTYNTNQYIIKGITTTHYTLEEVKHKFKYTEPIINDKDWELVPNKFDINTLKTFDQVLVRLTNNCVWMPKFFSYYDNDPKVKYYPFVTIDNIGYPQCIPYNGNEHLCRTTDDCNKFYKVWEK